MNKEQVDQAFAVVAQACIAYKGDLNEHQAIQNALNVLREALKPADEVIKPEVVD